MAGIGAMARIKSAIGVLALLALTSPMAQGEVRFESRCGGLPPLTQGPSASAKLTPASLTVWLGEISDSDAREIGRRIAMLKESRPSTSDPLKDWANQSDTAHCGDQHVDLTVMLDSPGGSVEAAMKIGEMLRAEDGTVVLRDGKICFSACVLVLAGAQRRVVDPGSRVGIHRPYMKEAVQTTSTAMQRAYRDLTGRVERYLDASGANPRLAADMMSIPPERMKVLNRQELLTYGLTQSSVGLQESDEMRVAKSLKISRPELVQRRAKVNAVCGEIERECGPSPSKVNWDRCFEYSRCEDSIMGGK